MAINIPGIFPIYMHSYPYLIVCYITCDVPNSPPDEGCAVAPNKLVDGAGFAPKLLVAVGPKLLVGGLNAELVPNDVADVPNPVEKLACPATPIIHKMRFLLHVYTNA